MIKDRLREGFDYYLREVVGRHPGWLALASLVVTLLAIGVVATQWNINSDFQQLLPGDSEAAQAMQEVSDRVGSGSSLFVVIDSPDRQANRDFAYDYAEALRAHPDVALAHFHNDKEFFERHKLLYVDADDLEQLHQEVENRIRDERRRQNPLYVSLDDGDDPVDTSDIEETYEQQAHQDYREYLEADDGYSLTIVVRFSEASTDLETTRRLLDEIEELGLDLEPERYHEDMTLEFGGGLVHRDGEYASIVDDIQLSAVFTLVGLFLLVSLYFRRTRAVALLLVPLLMAVLWTFALAFLIFGELTTISVFVFAILLGLGIDFSIHLLNGYDRERLNGHEPLEALVACYNSVGKATIMGGTTTFATFIVLSFAQFRGLSQFGQVSAIGVVMMVLAVIVALPALLLTIQHHWPHTPKRDKTAQVVLSFDRWFTYDNLGRAVPWMLALSVVFTALAAWQVPNLEFEENFRTIGDVEPPWQTWFEKSEQEQSIAEARRAGEDVAADVEERTLEVREAINPDSFVPEREHHTTGDKYTSALQGQHSSTPTLLLMDHIDDAALVQRHLSQLKDDGELETVRSLSSIHAFMPGSDDEQQRRLEIIADIEATLADEDLDEMSDGVRGDLQQLEDLSGIDRPISIYDMPEWTKRMFREAGPQARTPAADEEFAFEYLIYVNEAIDHMVGDQARQFLGEVQRGVAETEVDVRIGSQSFIYTAMLDEIRHDGAVMLGIAMIVVLLLLTLYFRSPLRAGMALIPLTVGAIWMFGFAAWFGIRLDFFNVVILPVIIGIGIDDGLHVYHRYLDLGQGSIIEVTYHVGAAVGMTTVTSMVGFGGLAITDYAGLQSIGHLAITGLASAFLATLLILPALLWVAERFQWQLVLPEHQYDPD